MNHDISQSISIEKLAAYLDGNLPVDEMNSVESLLSTDDDLQALVSASDVIDEDAMAYVNDTLAYNADMAMLDETEIVIPDLSNIEIDTDTFDVLVSEMPLEADEVEVFTQSEEFFLTEVSDAEVMPQPTEVTPEIAAESATEVMSGMSDETVMGDMSQEVSTQEIPVEMNLTTVDEESSLHMGLDSLE